MIISNVPPLPSAREIFSRPRRHCPVSLSMAVVSGIFISSHRPHVFTYILAYHSATFFSFYFTWLQIFYVIYEAFRNFVLSADFFAGR